MLLLMASEINDSALMMRYCDGDMSAFEALYARHRGPLFRFVLRQLSNPQIAEDVFQEIWAKVIRSRANYRPTAKFSTYLYSIARNCIVDQYRKAGRAADVNVAQDTQTPEPQATTHDPEKTARQAEVNAALLAALANLPQEQREAFLLKEESGLSLEDIGAVTGVSRETVKSRLRYALNKLRTCLPTPAEVRINDG
jgi:RNA polymerase sigma-70 factor (ECF subfamily)